MNRNAFITNAPRPVKPFKLAIGMVMELRHNTIEVNEVNYNINSNGDGFLNHDVWPEELVLINGPKIHGESHKDYWTIRRDNREGYMTANDIRDHYEPI